MNEPGNSAAPQVECFLCRSKRHSTYAQVTAGKLKDLWHITGRTFAQDAWPAIPDDYNIEMQQCDDCGFLFFDPGLAGNEAFYQSLDRPGYFSPFRDEFSRALEFA